MRFLRMAKVLIFLSSGICWILVFSDEISFQNIPVASVESLEITAWKSKGFKMLYSIDIQV